MRELSCHSPYGGDEVVCRKRANVALRHAETSYAANNRHFGVNWLEKCLECCSLDIGQTPRAPNKVRRSLFFFFSRVEEQDHIYSRRQRFLLVDDIFQESNFKSALSWHSCWLSVDKWARRSGVFLRYRVVSGRGCTLLCTLWLEQRYIIAEGKRSSNVTSDERTVFKRKYWLSQDTDM